MSATQRRFGAGAVKSRPSRSDGRSWPAGPGIVVCGRFLLDCAPAMPISLISRSTVHRATTVPSRSSSCQIFFAPYSLRPLFSRTRLISFFSSSSRISRADGFSSLFFAA